jgi:hypothetical protein
VGFRQPGTAAEGACAWQSRTLAPGEQVTFAHHAPAAIAASGVDRAAMLRAEVATFGDEQGVLFRRFGPAMLWGHWDNDLQWDARAMPFSLRFAVANGMDQDWSEVRVRLSCPDGWSAQGREPLHWPPGTFLQSGTISLELGGLQAGSQSVAPFWVRGPRGYEVRSGWSDDTRPFHANSQPGPGLTIGTPDVSEPIEVTFEAELSAMTSDGSISRRLAIPVHIIPCH